MIPSWTEERLEIVQTMWAAGSSTRQIADALGAVTRNAVMGVIHRRGFKGGVRQNAPQARVAAPRKPRIVKPTMKGEKSPLKVAIEATPMHIAFAELRNGVCKYPYGEKPPFTFCGCDAIGETPWCAAHAQLVYAKNQPETVAEAAE